MKTVTRFPQPPHTLAIKTHVYELNKWKLTRCKCGTPISWGKFNPFVCGRIDIDFKMTPWVNATKCKLCNVGVSSNYY